jgi:hypothetical protein
MNFTSSKSVALYTEKGLFLEKALKKLSPIHVYWAKTAGSIFLAP